MSCHRNKFPFFLLSSVRGTQLGECLPAMNVLTHIDSWSESSAVTSCALVILLK